MDRKDMKSMTLQEIQADFAELKLPKYKALQVYKWLHRGVQSFEEMSDQSKAMREQVLDCLDMVHGKELIDKRVGTLSGGELQRVLLALALEPLPNILILDEPLSGVDVEGMETLMDMLDEIRKTYDLSILMTTHDFSMLPRYADQVVLIDHAVLRKGTPEEVLNSPEFNTAFHMRGGNP